MWTFPTTPDLIDVTSRLAKVLAGVCTGYLLGAERVGGLAVDGAGAVDASAWRGGDSLLVSIVNSDYQDTTGSVALDFPGGMVATGIISFLWGDGQWRLTASSPVQIRRSGVRGLSTDILILTLEPQLLLGGHGPMAMA